MNGILSATPGQGAIRLVVGSHGLLLVQSVLLLQGDLLAMRAWPMVAILTVMAALMTIVAVVGDRNDHDHPWRSRHDR